MAELKYWLVIGWTVWFVDSRDWDGGGWDGRGWDGRGWDGGGWDGV